MHPEALTRARAALAAADRVAVLTGAGISAASGIPTFRGPDGLWQGRRPEELASPAAYARDPVTVWRWYAMRLGVVRGAEPNAAHRALVALEARAEVTVVTQNVDGLHARAGSSRVVELHGSLGRGRCMRCDQRHALPDPLPDPATAQPSCPSCGARARPDVVWFGEVLPSAALEGAIAAFAGCDVALVIGTSGRVEPAASLARLAAEVGAFLIEINPDPTPLSAVADASLRAGAVEGLAALLEG